MVVVLLKKSLPRLVDKSISKFTRHPKFLYGVLCCIIVVGTMIFYHGMDHLIGQSYQRHTRLVETARIYSSEITRPAMYHDLVDWGDQYLAEHRYDQAQWEYVAALRLFPKRMDANIGLANVLEVQCESSGQYCNEAKLNEQNIFGLSKLD